MDNNRICSSKKHKQKQSIFYCENCNIYMCKGCYSSHSDLFENHTLLDLKKKDNKKDKDNFTGYCQEEFHKDVLEYFCETHSKLCCKKCISENGGQHAFCCYSDIEKIQEEKRKKLLDNIQTLENLLKYLDNDNDRLKSFFSKRKTDKEKLKTKVKNTFTMIKNGLNNREKEILLMIDKLYDKNYGSEELIQESKILLELGRAYEKKWDSSKNKNKLSMKINDCINIEKNLKNLKRLCENLESIKKIYFFPRNEKCNLKHIKEQILENLLNKNDYKIISYFFKRWIMAAKKKKKFDNDNDKDSDIYLLKNNTKLNEFLEGIQKFGYLRYPTNEIKIIMLGIEGAGKSTILKYLKTYEIFNSVPTLPTIGFNVEELDYNGINLIIWDVGGQDKVRILWKHYFEKTDCLIYVVDSNDRDLIEEAKDEFIKTIQEEELKDSAILIYANKQDLNGCMTIDEITEKFGMKQLERKKWKVQGVSMDGKGIKDGMDWITSILKDKKECTNDFEE